MKKIKPLWGRVVVKPFDVTETDETFKNTRIIIAEEAKKKEQRAQMEGEFICAGGNAFEDWKDDALPKPGDRVMFDKYVGFHKKVDGVEYRIMNDTDIIAIVE